MGGYSPERYVRWKVRKAILERDKACAYCGRPVARVRDNSEGGPNDQWRAYDERGQPFHFHHKIPFSRGGTSDKSNVILACAECNLEKGARLEGEEQPSKNQKCRQRELEIRYPKLEPLCGWDWFREHLSRVSSERILSQQIQIVCDGQLLGSFAAGDAGRPVREAMKEQRA